MKEKNLSIETLRGIAILLVVIGHVVGSGPSGGMKIDFPHPLRYLYLWIDYIQMPLFTAIAGWVYALKPMKSTGCFPDFACRKALRLLVPMAVVGTLYFLLQYLMPGTNNKGDLCQLWRIYIFPYTIYWYLPSLFLIFVVQGFLDCQKWMDNWREWSVCCAIAVFLSWTNDIGFMHSMPNLFSFKGALGQLPYFFAGVAACRFSMSRPAEKKGLLIASASGGVILIQVVWFLPDYAALAHDAYIITLLPLLYALLHLRWHCRFFTWVGGYAYSIYLFHGFGTSGGRILLKMVGMNSVALILLFATFIASACPIIVDRVMSRIKWGRRLLLGKAA